MMDVAGSNKRANLQHYSVNCFYNINKFCNVATEAQAWGYLVKGEDIVSIGLV
jgi:hypothetical protein